ncbi:GDSL esterase/lipase At5g45910-like isoform X1 [Phragmites australis]|uniref:GDSL esterase/lipase At5g45910-like isoform X1 n=1 Tax=Phragmites australis TaxID=29695 RepID=UPI002D798607|nr:GDSL esterase/lipase At5g45910-like isoform X1 [Phragmites australis]
MRNCHRMASEVLLAVLCSSWVLAAAAQKYNAIFNFGDSITDTGNLCTNNRPSQITFTQPPYGETYFGMPTCRCSDGRVIPDFMSSSFGLPFLPPSKSTSADFKKGANMAITGATAMDADFFRSLGLSDKIWNNGPISFQLQWFQQITTSVCGQADCKSYLGNSLFVFGEFGGNDYNAMLFGNYNADQASTYTPTIVNTISNGIEKLIAMGATDIVVPGVLPIGCFPIYLTIYGTSNSGDYDSLGCLKKFNDLSTYHNNQLQTKVASLQAKYSSARIMYADFYSGVYDMVKNPQSYGFSTVFETCCGSGGGKYNYQNSARCGMAGASACANPAAHLSWDGIHLTEAAYKQITDGWLNGPYCRPAILHS